MDYTKNVWLAGLIGAPVTVIPHRGVGMSRDTEAGLQPWQGTFRGFDPDGHPLVQSKGYEPRAMRGELTVTRHGLQIGRYN